MIKNDNNKGSETMKDKWNYRKRTNDEKSLHRKSFNWVVEKNGVLDSLFHSEKVAKSYTRKMERK